MSPTILWSIRLLMDLWISFFVFLTVVPSVSYSAISSACPRDLETHVNSCFTNYSFHSQSLNASPKLCCGVDVETLRGVCHSYTRAIRCIKALKTACPSTQHHTIDRMMVNLDGESNAGLMDLCKDDNVIEDYAMYQWCFADAGRRSESCFSTNLKDSTAIRFLSKVNTKHKDSFCRNMRDTVGCVQHNIERSCGARAASLVVLLVRPMVRDSSQCDYTLVDDNSMGSKTTDRESPAYISDDSRYNRDSKSGSSSAKKSNKNQRRHKNRNSNSDQLSNRGSNTGSHSGENPRGGASSVRFTGIHCNPVLFTAVIALITVSLRRFLIGSIC